jgi:hypothetical protein
VRYEIEFTAGADRDVDDLPGDVARAICEAVLALVVTVWIVGHRSSFYEKARRRRQPDR